MQSAVVIFTFVRLLKLSVVGEKIKCGTKVYSIYNSNDDAHCYWNQSLDDLPLLEKGARPPKSIYFIDASCKGGLNVREACSVEAAAKVNPKRQVNVFFVGPVFNICLTYEPLLSLQSYENIRLRRIYLNEYSNNTGFRQRLERSIIHEGSYPNLYVLDLLKFLTLYKFDGVYMDLDVMATRPFDDLPRPKNWVAIEDHAMRTLSSAILSASFDNKGRQLVNTILNVLFIGMSSSEWSADNFNVIRAAVERMHGPLPFHRSKKGSSFKKYDFIVYASMFFSPVSCDNSAEYFDSKLDIKNLTKSFTQQLCNGMTYENPITKNSTYAKLMNQFCPKVYEYLVSIDFKEII